MKVNTKAFGLIEVDDKQKITIPEGLYGFEDYTEYVIMDAENQPFYWLQSQQTKTRLLYSLTPSFSVPITN